MSKITQNFLEIVIIIILDSFRIDNRDDSVAQEISDFLSVLNQSNVSSFIVLQNLCGEYSLTDTRKELIANEVCGLRMSKKNKVKFADLLIRLNAIRIAKRQEGEDIGWNNPHGDY